MRVGIVGLGLIGGSLAKAYTSAGHSVFALDSDKKILQFGELNGDIAGELDCGNIGQCELVIFALYPAATIDLLKELSPHISRNAVVIDCCGTKRDVCAAGFSLAKKYGFLFCGGHPMAGLHLSGYKYSKSDLFKGAPMVIVPPSFDDIGMLNRVKEMLSPAQFGFISVTTAGKHDEIIAFTSQLPHLLSNNFIKSPTSLLHKGFSAGSFKDFTRVAWLNSDMWAGLLLENKDCLLSELDLFLNNLNEYKTAIEQDDFERLRKLLQDGREQKEEVEAK